MKTINFEIKNIDKIINASCITKEGSLVEQIYTVLRRHIINLSLLPEMPLVEKEIAEIFEISKTPVREALIRLANDKLVTIVPKSGSYVTPISLERYFEACFIRVTLTSGCVKRLADKGISLSEQVKLKSIITEQQQLINAPTTEQPTSDLPSLFELSELFHRSLFEYAGILGAWHLLDSSKAEIDRVKQLKKIVGINSVHSVVDEQLNILEALTNRDPIAAETAMIAHIGSVDDAMNIISNNPQFIQSMEEFNLLINEHRKRRNANKFNGKLFASKRFVF